MTRGRFPPPSPLLDEARRLLRHPHRPGPGEESPAGPSEALAAVEPLLARLGITRVGDLTALDTIGIPVWFACRPNARSLSVAQGKGLTDGQARLSAIMEAAEAAVAERTRPCIDGFASLVAMRRGGLSTVPLERMPRVTRSRLDPDRERAWVSALSLRHGERVFVPYELVGLDMRTDMPWDHSAFRMTSVGLAAGIGLARPFLHALLELVENDATAPFERFGPSRSTLRPLAHRIGESAALDDAVARLGRAAVAVRFADCTGEIPLPVVAAFVEWPDAASGATATRWCAGFACRSDPLDAALAALLEAVQSRLTNIAGARDDIAPRDYRSASRPRFSECGDAPSIGTLAARHPGSGGGLMADIRHALGAIFGAGIADVFLAPLEVAGTTVRVVRVLATELAATSPYGAAGIDARTVGPPLPDAAVSA